MVFGGEALATFEVWDDPMLEMHTRLATRVRRMLERGIREAVFAAETDVDSTVLVLQEIFQGWMCPRFGSTPKAGGLAPLRRASAAARLLIDGLRARADSSAQRGHS